MRLIIADDHPAVRYGLRSILEMEKNIEIIGEVKNGDELLAMLAENPADLALVDLNMPGKDGIKITKMLKKLYPKLKVLAFSIYDDHYKVLKMMRAGADGYLLKSADRSEIIEALNSVMRGEKFVSKELADKMVQDAVPGSGKKPVVALSGREEEVLKMIANDIPYKEMAARLNISKRTIDTHRYNISKKLGIKSVAGLIRYALNHGIA